MRTATSWSRRRAASWEELNAHLLFDLLIGYGRWPLAETDRANNNSRYRDDRQPILRIEAAKDVTRKEEAVAHLPTARPLALSFVCGTKLLIAAIPQMHGRANQG
jgi:hypothetical protein